LCQLPVSLQSVDFMEIFLWWRHLWRADRGFSPGVRGEQL